nr:transposase [Rhizobium leguminosarum]
MKMLLNCRCGGRDGRRRYDPASRDQLVAACLEAGVSVSRLAREHGVNANLVRKWMKKTREERPLPWSRRSSRFRLLRICTRLLPAIY